MISRGKLLLAAVLLVLSMAACTLGSTIGMMIDVAMNFGIPSPEESDALNEILDGDRTAGIVRLERVLAKYEADGERKSAQRVRSLLGSQYVEVGRIDEAQAFGKILASDPGFRDIGLALLISVSEARGDTRTAATLGESMDDVLDESFFFMRFVIWETFLSAGL